MMTGQAQRGAEAYLQPIHNPALEERWVVSTKLRPFYLREIPGTHCTDGWKPRVLNTDKYVCVSFTVEIEGVQLPGSAGSDISVITQAQEGQHFVSIDGKRTYINLFGSSTEQGGIAPTRIQQGGHTAPPHKSASTIGTG